MPVRQKDAQRALELLQQYRVKLEQRQSSGSEDDSQLHSSLDRVISVFQSQLFNALLVMALEPACQLGDLPA